MFIFLIYFGSFSSSSEQLTFTNALWFWVFVLYIYIDILVPLDNYISRGTQHFITCKEPDYQQSLWTMISSVSYIYL